MINRYWKFNIKKNCYEPSDIEPLSLFPTIVNMEKKIVYCRQCHRWEYITGFSNNILTSQCGKKYEGPFTVENSILNYGYDINMKHRIYYILVKSQTVVLHNRRLLESSFELNLEKKILYKNGKAIFESEDLRTSLCKEITDFIINDMAEDYSGKFGIKPTITSKFKGFNLIVGYMLCPFNINFFKISKHWGLNPYDKNFTDLSSGDTPSAEKEMFECLGIKPNKSIRKKYQEFPQSVICYSAISDLGFTDVNLLMKSTTPKFYAFFSYLMITFAGGTISYSIRDSLKIYVQDLLEVTNNDQKTVWNSIERTVDVVTNQNVANLYVVDAVNGYEYIRNDITDKEKKDIMHEGFNRYTHDFIINRINQLQNIKKDKKNLDENIQFTIPSNYLDLDYKCGENFKSVKINGKNEMIKIDDKDRYCFYVAKDTYTLKKIGSEMNNCVGWAYINSAMNLTSIIVYAKYKEKYKICIEVSPDFYVRQALGPSNQVLQGESLEAYHEWFIEKHLNIKKAFH